MGHGEDRADDNLRRFSRRRGLRAAQGRSDNVLGVYDRCNPVIYPVDHSPVGGGRFALSRLVTDRKGRGHEHVRGAL